MSVMVREAVRAPTAVGVKVTVIVQLPLAATELAHVLVWAKSPGLAPVKPMLLMLRAVFPVLFTVTNCATLVVERDWLPKVRLVVLRLTAAPAP